MKKLIIIVCIGLASALFTWAAWPEKEYSEESLGQVWIVYEPVEDVDYWNMYATNTTGKNVYLLVKVRQGSQRPQELAYTVYAEHNTVKKAQKLRTFYEYTSLVDKQWGYDSLW